MMLLEDWYTIIDDRTIFSKPKDKRMVLVGEIYGHQKVKDGTRIKTSTIEAIGATTNPGILVFTTREGSKFEVREVGMNEKFRIAFPDGFAMLRDKAWGK